MVFASYARADICLVLGNPPQANMLPLCAFSYRFCSSQCVHAPSRGEIRQNMPHAFCSVVTVVFLNYCTLPCPVKRSFQKIQRHSLHTSTQEIAPEYSSSSSGVSSILLVELPQAGNTVEKRRRDSSKYTSTPSGTPKGHTPPTA